jgi:hydrogenase nickel incorporation protein HypA/HybF
MTVKTMHELALAQDIVETIRTKVTENLEKVSAINIDVGAFSGVVPESLDFGLKVIMAEENNPDVNINITKVPSFARCECGNEYRVNEIFENCSQCHSFNREMISGMDIVINSVELSEE